MKLTYTKADLRRMLKSVSYWNFPYELLNADQRARYDEGMKKLKDACEIYEKETGRSER